MLKYKATAHSVIAFAQWTIILAGVSLAMFFAPGVDIETAVGFLMGAVLTGVLFLRDLRTLRREGRLKHEMKILKPTSFREQWRIALGRSEPDIKTQVEPKDAKKINPPPP